MTTTEAIDLLETATGQLAMTRADHLKVAEALNVLRDNVSSDNDIKDSEV